MTCKDCIHYDVCVARVAVGVDKICSYFKDKSRIIELPCKIGDTVYYLCRDWIGGNYILEANVWGISTEIYEKTKRIYLKILFKDLDGNSDSSNAIYGVNAFSSREEAELKLKELSK